MQMTQIKKTLSVILCIVLIAAIALFTVGCGDNKDTSVSTTLSGTESPMSQSESDGTSEGGAQGNILGVGKTEFTFTVTDAEGKADSYQIKTDKATVGEALTELGLISGEEGPYGLYVKTVNGMTYDYDTDGKYWAFYINGEIGAKGVDQTEIIPGADYAFKAE